MTICSPDWIGDLVVVLERIYENPVYTEDHPNPYREFEQLEEIVEVSLYSKSNNITSFRCLIMIALVSMIYNRVQRLQDGLIS